MTNKDKDLLVLKEKKLKLMKELEELQKEERKRELQESLPDKVSEALDILGKQQETIAQHHKAISQLITHVNDIKRKVNA